MLSNNGSCLRAVRVIIFSSIFPPVSKLHALTLAANSYAILLQIIDYYLSSRLSGLAHVAIYSHVPHLP